MTNPKTGEEELRHIVLEQMDVRVDPSVGVGDLHDFLQYRSRHVRETPINQMRDTLMEFIKENRSRLSLPCNGNCYEHHDGVVLFCYNQLLEEKENG